ncbi:MAG: poly[(R)-3-hydroxyalkanoate] polymerase subunit PhaC [Pseudomonadota bacterium]|nr:poly[(R)-3-hydroxyalkanoate] polymerase subunit PhaC [Pseudomonadota bacterium]
MSKTTDPFAPAMQQFAQAGQAMAQQFFTFLGSREAQHPFGGSPIKMGAPDPAGLSALQQRFLHEQTQLWSAMMARGKEGAPQFEVKAEPGDRRFAAPEWQQSPVFDYIRQSYLLNSSYLRELVELAPVEDDKARNRLRFLARQYLDAMAPSNFAATNPEFVKLAVETKGKSITDGINNLIKDLEKGRISMTDDAAFEVGRNLATTPGAVVFENELIQLIQYSPLSDKVAKRPLVVVPPCINKFYILDLQAENSFIRYAVEQGNTVFLVSWRNVQAAQGHLGWNDFLEMGPLTALAVARDICKVDQVNALGFCVGGTILSSALAVLAARGEDPVASLTLLTTLLDFSDTGEIGLFIDEQSCATRDATIGKGGLLAGRELAGTFSALRANDLIWNYVSGNYLKGQKPQAFDLLYWNSDSTNLPGPFAAWYMRNLYLNNSLREPGKLEMCGVKVDLGKVRMPSYLLATREDHIVPWQTAYQSTSLLGGKARFVLGASGHIAGVVNPASKNKRSYWVNDDTRRGAEAWLVDAEEKKGSWWVDWTDWLKQHADGDCAARAKLGSAKYKAIEPAPGRYVKEKA